MLINEKNISGFVPDNCVKDINNLLDGHKVILQVKQFRGLKLGEFVVNNKTGKMKISINETLDKYSFLITLVHEIAHLYVWEKHQYKKIKPHGKEWKTTFNTLMHIFINKNIFPYEIECALRQYLLNPGASTFSSVELVSSLMPYSKSNKNTRLEQLPDDAEFILLNGMRMRKIRILRKRYECLCLDNNRNYTISPFAEVIPVINLNKIK